MAHFMIFALMLASNTASHPLPDHVDIPDAFSTVICPDQKAAQMMLDRYYSVKAAPNNHIHDTDLFFAGLKATGCSQDSPARKGTITIKSVHQRKLLKLADGNERVVRYSGVNSANAPVSGIVNEDGNNAFGRTELAGWKSERTSDGWLDARATENSIFFRCATPQQATAVVKAMQGQEKSALKAFMAKLEKQAAAQKCRPASDRYFVTSILALAGNACGFECYIDLTALGAVDRSGQTVGLIFDASLM
jgi:hypothetical protein